MAKTKHNHRDPFNLRPDCPRCDELRVIRSSGDPSREITLDDLEEVREGTLAASAARYEDVSPQFPPDSAIYAVRRSDKEEPTLAQAVARFSEVRRETFERDLLRPLAELAQDYEMEKALLRPLAELAQDYEMEKALVRPVCWLCLGRHTTADCPEKPKAVQGGAAPKHLITKEPAPLSSLYRQLVQDLAASDPTNDEAVRCHFCRTKLLVGEPHDADCLWLRARRLVT